MSGMPGPAAELGLGTVVTAARLKVLAALPDRAPLARLPARGTVPPRCRRLVPGQRAGPAPRDDRRGRLGGSPHPHRVRARRQPVSRDLGPLGAGPQGRRLVPRGDERRTRSARIGCRGSSGAVPLEERAARPAGFDLPTYWAESSAAYEREQPDGSRSSSACRRSRLGALADAVGMRNDRGRRAARRAGARLGPPAAGAAAGPTRSQATCSSRRLEPRGRSSRSRSARRIIATAGGSSRATSAEDPASCAPTARGRGRDDAIASVTPLDDGRAGRRGLNVLVALDAAARRGSRSPSHALDLH